jgi:glutamate dehydrogenase
MTAGASLLDLIGERTPAERAPAVRAFAQAFLRRLAADEDGEGPLVTEVLCGEIVGLFEFASARGEAPIAVRAFNPSLDEHGYESPGSVVETNTEDWPFLVDSVSADLRGRDLGIRRVLHPIVGVERGPDGAITAVLHPREASRRESVMHFDLETRLDPDALDELAAALRQVLEDVRACVRDFPVMADRARRMVQLAGAGVARYADDEVDETVAFLEWLLQDNFIFLGYREYRFGGGEIAVVPESGLGILAC